MMAESEALSNKSEAHMDDPGKIFEIIFDRYDKKCNKKLSNLCKELESFTLKNTKVETDYWFTDLSHFNNRIEKIITDFKNIEKLLAMHIMNNMRKEYKELKLDIENKGSYLDDLG